MFALFWMSKIVPAAMFRVPTPPTQPMPKGPVHVAETLLLIVRCPIPTNKVGPADRQRAVGVGHSRPDHAPAGPTDRPIHVERASALRESRRTAVRLAAFEALLVLTFSVPLPLMTTAPSVAPGPVKFVVR